VPVVAPISAGRHGTKPQLIKLPSLKDEAAYLVERLMDAHSNGTAWRDMAVIYRHYDPVGKEMLHSLSAKGIPATFHKKATFSDSEDTVKVLTMHSCKGLEFPLVAIPGVDIFNMEETMDPEEVRLLYVAMTRATNELVVLGG
jgi:superfamily I DNA/RNA helicase